MKMSYIIASSRLPFGIELSLLRTRTRSISKRMTYQQKYVCFDVESSENVLDIGSGTDPFPFSTVHLERYLKFSRHRHTTVEVTSTPLVVSDVQNLPFSEKVFDFVYCSHVLEHVDNPLLACKEIMRIGKRGYIETPTLGKDSLFAWARDMHKWHVVAIDRNLCFFEYSERQLDGVRSHVWRDLIHGRWAHPLQDVFFDNQDIFNVMFSWTDHFKVFVFYLDGRVEVGGR